MSGGLRPRPSIRTSRLEELAKERELGLEGLSAPERHWLRAQELAPPEELEELERLGEMIGAPDGSSSSSLGTPGELERGLQVLAVEERIMHRAAPTLAADIRIKRDLLAHALRHLEAQAERAADPEGPEWWPALREAFSEAKEGGASNLEAGVAMDQVRQRLESRHQAASRLLWQREDAVRGGAEPISDPETAIRLAEELLAQPRLEARGEDHKRRENG